MNTTFSKPTSYGASVDDNADQLLYSSGWGSVFMSIPASSMVASLHETSVEGSTATFKFDASIQIDDGPVVIHAQASTNDDQWRAVLWESDVLPSGPHILTITNLGDNLVLDSIAYKPVPSPVSSAGFAGNVSTSTFATSTSVFPTTSSSNSSPMDSFPRTAPLAGVIVAGMLVFTLLVYYFLRPIRKHSKLRRLEEAEMNDSLYELKVKRSISLSACTLKEPELGSPFSVTSAFLPSHGLTDAQRSYTVKGRQNVARREHSLQRHEHFTRAITPPSGRLGPVARRTQGPNSEDETFDHLTSACYGASNICYRGLNLGKRPVISFRVYNRTIIVLNSVSAIRTLLDHRAAIYSERPMSWMYNVICARGQAVFNVSASDPRHRVYRRLLQTGLSRKAVEASGETMRREAAVLVQSLGSAPEKWTQHVRRNTAGVIMKLAFGYTVKDLDDSFITVAEESAKISGWATAPGRWMVDYYPLLRYVPSAFPGAEWKRQGLVWREQLSHLSDVPYRWVKGQIANGTNEESFISRLLHDSESSVSKVITPDEEDAVRWCAGGLYAGAADTTVSALTSFVLLMALHPDVQRKAQEEINAVCNHGLESSNNEDWDVDAQDAYDESRMPHLANLEKLPYLLAIMKEVLRYAPVANLALPHCLAEDDTYMGFDLPKGASVVPNIWAVMHDPELYPDPFKFNPDRFVHSNDGPTPATYAVGGLNEPKQPLTQPDPRQFAYGFGKRVCPGTHFAETTLLLNMATILMWWNIHVSDGVQPDVEFTTGITSHIKPFPVDFIRRFSV
ncbi:hypothetical protein D9619_011049 [Psilocybe cf. subviscida]|uniref:Cytochrome P450 n=1 Tax=Psilocybe cf. subviscida TaxID=2480587 RepID=A0A8H5B8H6_9AGAR|nr:hypothetical protein D9619_011049 [Psilocybe cf. subviscida]